MLLLRRGSFKQEGKAIRAVDGLACVLRFGRHLAGANAFNRDNQSRQYRWLGEWHVMLAENELDLRSESGEALYRCDILIKIGFRPIKPDWRGIVSVSGEKQPVSPIKQRNRIGCVAGCRDNFDRAAAEINLVVIV